MKFAEYKGLDLPKVAEEVLHYWKENNVFEKSGFSSSVGSNYTKTIISRKCNVYIFEKYSFAVL